MASLVLFVAAGTYKIAESLGSHSAAQPVEVVTHVVQPRETEWDLANRVKPNSSDTGDVALEIDQMLPPDAAHANHTVQPGDTIVYTNKGNVISYSEPGSAK